MTTLSAERSGLSGRPGVGPGQADALATRARQTGAWTDPVLRDRIMQAFVAERALQMSTVRAFAHLGRAEPGAEGSIRKLTHAQLEATFGLLATEVEPGGAIAWAPAPSASPTPRATGVWRRPSSPTRMRTSASSSAAPTAW